MRPDFSKKHIISRWVKFGTVKDHRVVALTIPEHVRQQVASGKRIWTRGQYAHSVTVTTGYGAFEFAWDDDVQTAAEMPRRYLAERIYSFNERMRAIQMMGRAA